MSRIRPRTPVEQLWQQKVVKIPEAMRMTGYTRERVNKRIKAGHWEFITEDGFKLILVSSLRKYFKEDAQGAAA